MIAALFFFPRFKKKTFPSKALDPSNIIFGSTTFSPFKLTAFPFKNSLASRLEEANFVAIKASTKFIPGSTSIASKELAKSNKDCSLRFLKSPLKIASVIFTHSSAASFPCTREVTE